MTSKTIITGLLAIVFVTGIVSADYAHAVKDNLPSGQPFQQLETRVGDLEGAQFRVDSFFDVFFDITTVDSFFDIFTELQSSTSQLRDDLAAEAAARAAADAALQAQLDAEEAARAAADGAERIARMAGDSAEAAARAAADAALQAQIDSLSARIAAIESP